MKKMKVSEFHDWLNRQSMTEYILASINQSRAMPPVVDLVLRFDTLAVDEAGRRLCFSGPRGSVCFNAVREVQLYDKHDSAWIEINIICKNNREEGYCVLAY